MPKLRAVVASTGRNVRTLDRKSCEVLQTRALLSTFVEVRMPRNLGGDLGEVVTCLFLMPEDFGGNQRVFYERLREASSGNLFGGNLHQQAERKSYSVHHEFTTSSLPSPSSIFLTYLILIMALDSFFHNKIESMKLEIIQGQAVLRRLEAQRNDYNSRGDYGTPWPEDIN